MRAPVRPVDQHSARHEAQAAECSWNTKDPRRVVTRQTTDPDRSAGSTGAATAGDGSVDHAQRDGDRRPQLGPGLGRRGLAPARVATDVRIAMPPTVPARSAHRDRRAAAAGAMAVWLVLLAGALAGCGDPDGGGGGGGYVANQPVQEAPGLAGAHQRPPASEQQPALWSRHSLLSGRSATV